MLIARFSSQAHERMLLFRCRSIGRLSHRDVVANLGQIETHRDLEGPLERPAPLGLDETLDHRVQVRPPARCRASRIGYDARTRADHHTQQLSFGSPGATPYAGPDWTREIDARNHRVNLIGSAGMHLTSCRDLANPAQLSAVTPSVG